MQNRRKGATAYAYAVKNLRTPKPSHTKKTFCGHCLYGLYEAAMPVIIGESVAAVVYVGNAITDIDQTNCRIDKACHYTNADCQQLYEQTKEREHLNCANELLKIAEIVCDYIKMLYVKEQKTQFYALVSFGSQTIFRIHVLFYRFAS